MPSFSFGTEKHIPQIAMPGKFPRIWAEPETQGEAYIPFAMDRRARAEGILSEVAKKFGGVYRPGPEAIAAAAVEHLSLPARFPVNTAVPLAAGGGDLASEIAGLRADVRAVESAVYAGASHVGDRYQQAVDTQVRRQGLVNSTGSRTNR